MNRKSQELIRMLEERITRFDGLLKTEAEPAKRSVFGGWRDATIQALADVRYLVEQIEDEARLVPSEEEPFESLVERELVA